MKEDTTQSFDTITVQKKTLTRGWEQDRNMAIKKETIGQNRTNTGRDNFILRPSPFSVFCWSVSWKRVSALQQKRRLHRQARGRPLPPEGTLYSQFPLARSSTCRRGPCSLGGNYAVRRRWRNGESLWALTPGDWAGTWRRHKYSQSINPTINPIINQWIDRTINWLNNQSTSKWLRRLMRI